MHVRDLLDLKHREVITIAPDATVDAAMELLLYHKISCLPAVNSEGELQGIISDKDIFRAAYESDTHFKEMSVGDLMSTDLIVGVLDDMVDYIAAVMTNNRIRHVPIVVDNRLIGLVSLGDIVKAQLQDLQVTNRYLQLYIEGNYPG